jgi:hypothetical protein
LGFVIHLSFETFTFEAKVVEDNFFESLVKDLIPKSHFLDMDEKEIENVNKGGH